jgi:SsrA-binding protein
MQKLEIKNRQAFLHYHFDDTFIAGIVLMGTEVKSIRDSKVSFNDAYCIFYNNELWV